MKPTLTALILLATASLAGALTTIGTVQHSNGSVTTPGFWTANSNAINAVVGSSDWNTLSNKPAWISTNPAVSLSNLTTTNYVTTLGLHVPSFSATNARLAYWSLSGNVSQAGVGLNTNATPDLQASIGLGTNNAVRFAEVSVGEFTISGSGTGTYGGDDIFELRTNGLFINQPALTISSLGLAPTDIVTFGGVAAGVVTNVVGSGDIAAANEVSGLRGTFGELNLGNNGFALAEDEFGRMTLTGDLYFLSASNAAVFRANAGMPWSGLTNANAAGFRNALNLSSWTTNPSSPLFSLPPEAVRYEGDSIKVADSAELGQAGVILAPYFVGAWAAGTTNAWISGSYTPGQPVTVNGPIALSSTNFRGPTLSNLGLGYLGTNAATTISNLFASNSLPSGGAPEGAIYTVVGGQYVGVASRETRIVLATNVPTTNSAVTQVVASATVEANTTYLLFVSAHIDAAGVGYDLRVQLPSSYNLSNTQTGFGSWLTGAGSGGVWVGLATTNQFRIGTRGGPSTLQMLNSSGFFTTGNSGGTLEFRMGPTAAGTSTLMSNSSFMLIRQ